MSKIENGGLDQLTLDPSNSSNLDQLVLKGLMLFNDIKTIILTQFLPLTDVRNTLISSSRLTTTKTMKTVIIVSAVGVLICRICVVLFFFDYLLAPVNDGGNGIGPVCLCVCVFVCPVLTQYMTSHPA